MSLYDYRAASHLITEGAPFRALLIAAMRVADSDNARRLRQAFPEVWAEAQRRYEVPGGVLPEERT